MTDNTPETDDATATDDGLPLSRRAALALMGAGGVAAASTTPAAATHSEGDSDAATRSWNQHIDAKDHDLTNVGSLEAGHASLGSLDVDSTFTSAREADVIVWKDDDGTWYADGEDEQVATGDDVLAVTQAALDSLTDGRDHKEKVLVASPGTATGEVDRLSVPSYTVLDIPFRIHAPPESEIEYVVHATDETDIEIPRLRVTGAPFIACRLQGVKRTTVGDFRYYADPEEDTDDGIRFDDWGGEARCEDVQLGSAYVEHSDNHGVETVNVHRFQAEQIIGNDTDGTACLLNTTTDATVNSVIGYETGRPNDQYATFRLANDNQNISVGQVVSRGGYGRGLAIITDAQRVSIGEVDIAEPGLSGIQLVDAADVTIGGGVIRNPGDHGVNIYSHLGEPVNENITVTDLRIVDDRDEKEMEYAINEGGECANNRFVDNDLDRGTQGTINVGSSTTVVRDNTGGGLDEGTVTLTSGDPAARVEGVSSAGSSALESRIQPVQPPETAFGFDTHFEWTGGEWDLVIEWTNDPGEDVEATYIVDRDQPNLTGVETGPPTEWNPDEVDQEEGAGIIDGFEDDDLSEYVGSTGAYDVNEDPPVAEGDFSLKNEGSAAVIGSFAGLDRYPSAGDTFAANVASTETEHVFGLLFGMQDLENFYFTRYSYGNNIQIWRVEDGGYNELASSDDFSVSDGEILDYVVDWGTDGTITVEAHDGDGNVLGSVSVEDDTFTEGGIGTRRSGMLDNIRITDAGSQ